VKAGPSIPVSKSLWARPDRILLFPHDEFADAGLRPTIFKICNEAPAGAAVGGEAQPVFAYYFTNAAATICIISVSPMRMGKRCRPPPT